MFLSVWFRNVILGSGVLALGRYVDLNVRSTSFLWFWEISANTILRLSLYAETKDLQCLFSFEFFRIV